jgi:hypothetical protein
MKMIAIISSPLQRAAFDASSAGQHNATIIGNRGMPGDHSYEKSVLNDAHFLDGLNKLIGEEDTEIFIPNSLNLLYYFAVSNPSIKRISYLDEGRLTKHYLTEGYRKQTNPFHLLIGSMMRITQKLPNPLRIITRKFISRFINILIIQRYTQNVSGYPYRCIERNNKGGTILSHASYDTMPEDVEVVDITQNISFAACYVGYSCLFLHPRHCDVQQLLKKLQSLSFNSPLLIRPHPNFTRAPEKLQSILSAFRAEEIHCEIATLSEVQEVTIELYDKGVRCFICGETTITDTVEAHPDYFKELRVVKI